MSIETEFIYFMYGYDLYLRKQKVFLVVIPRMVLYILKPFLADHLFSNYFRPNKEDPYVILSNQNCQHRKHVKTNFCVTICQAVITF